MTTWISIVACGVLAATVAAGAGGGGAGKPAVIRVEVTTPDAGWRLTIAEVRRVRGELWVLARLLRSGDMAAQVISKALASVPVDPAGAVVKVFVTGKTWKWANDEPYAFVRRDEIDPAFDQGEPVYPAAIR